MLRVRQTRVVLATAHLDHDPGNNAPRNLKSFCQRCHMIYDRPYHLARRRITYLLRQALGDLFLGPYSSWSVQAEWETRRAREKGSRHGVSSVVFAGRRPQARRYAAPCVAPGLDRADQQGLELGMP